MGCSGPRTNRKLYRSLVSAVVSTLLVPAVPAFLISTPAGATAQNSPAPASASCLGAHDLLIDNGTSILTNTTVDHLCVQNHSTLTLEPGAVLRAGFLYIDQSSTLSAVGAPGGRPDATDCPGSGNGQPDGSPGATITVLANTAVVRGAINADGGQGVDGSDTNCANVVDPGGNGGRGGNITLKTVHLTLSGTIHAAGGDGGTGSPNAGAGGAGGTVHVEVQPPIAFSWSSQMLATAGKNPTTKLSATPGTVSILPLSMADSATVPIAAPPLSQQIGPLPKVLPPQSASLFETGMQCSTGDLDVQAGATVHLHGTLQYRHVCIQGTVVVESQLVLLAHTILIASSGKLLANGVQTQKAPAVLASSCTPTHALPQPGSAGADGAASFDGPGGKGGRGGGSIALVASRLLFAGSASVDGTPGAVGLEGSSGSPTSGDIPPSDGGNGGDGGSISLVASDLQMTGTISTLGGRGGLQGVPVDANSAYHPPAAPHGVSGCTRIFASTLRASSAALILPSTLYYGHTLAVDPVLPAGSHYRTVTLHTVGAPFLGFWQQNGLALVGEPLSEPFVENGKLVQYFERSRLTIVGGKLTISPLGALLTAGRSFPKVAPLSNSATSKYFPETGHSLTGRFLSYWLAHNGARLFGPPISQPLQESNGDGSGRRYLVQYFRNARMEYHPELKSQRYTVSLGALGREYLQDQKGWL